jgi:hypothetical protein
MSLSTAWMGLDRQDHWYGLAESMLTEHSVPTWNPFFVNNSEDDRWREAGRTWDWYVRTWRLHPECRVPPNGRALIAVES